MKNTYENGIETRNLILQTAKNLFLEKGFRETSFEDICASTYFNRSTVRYHFGSKENLRYEVFWTIAEEYRLAAAAYSSDPQMQWLAAIYILWRDMSGNAQIRQFFLNYCYDYPTYNAQNSFSKTHDTLYNHVFEDEWPARNISGLNYAMAYGHLTALSLLVANSPKEYDVKDMFYRGIKICLHCWEWPDDRIESYCERVNAVLDVIP